MIGENYECDGQMNISDVFGVGQRPKAVLGYIKFGDCIHDCVLLKSGRKKYYKCVKCGKRFRYKKVI